MRSLGAARMAAMAAVTLALVGFFAFLMMQVTAPQMVPLFTDLSVEDIRSIIKDLERQAIPYEMKNDGAIIMVPKDKCRAAAHEARRRRPAERRRRRLRDFRQVGRARRHHLHPEHQSPARAGRRTGAHHPQPRPRAVRARPSRAARPAAVLARQDRAVGLDRAQGARHAGAAAGPRHPPSRRHRRQRPQAGARLGGRRNRPPARRRRRGRTMPRAVPAPTSARSLSNAACASRSRPSSRRWSAPAARASSSPPNSTSTASRRRPTNSIRKAASCARARRAKNSSDSGSTARTARCRSPTNCPAQAPRTKAPAARTESNKKTEEIVNYEISRITKTEVIEAGRVNRISAAVLVDGIYGKNDKGEVTYQPRAQGRNRPHRGAGAHRHRLRPEARRPGRSRQSALCRNAGHSDRRAGRLDELLARSPKTTSCAAPNSASWRCSA